MLTAPQKRERSRTRRKLLGENSLTNINPNSRYHIIGILFAKNPRYLPPIDKNIIRPFNTSLNTEAAHGCRYGYSRQQGTFRCILRKEWRPQNNRKPYTLAMR